MAASIFKNPKLLISKSLFSTQFSTLKPPFPSLRAAKSAILSESNPEKLAEMLDQCAQFPAFRRNRPIYRHSVRKLARANRPDLIDRVLGNHKDLEVARSEGFWVRLMMLYSEAGMVDQAMGTLDLLWQQKEKAFDLTEISLCASLSVHLVNGRYENVHKLFEIMPQRLGVNPGVVSHNLVLKAFVEENKVESARDWIEKMEKEGKVKPNIHSYNILLEAYWESDGARFDEVVKEVLQKGLEFNVTTYIYRIKRLSMNKECVRAKKLLDEMVLKGVKPNSACYHCIIDGFCRLGDFESAKMVLERMLADANVKPCSNTYFAFIRSMVKEGEFESALQMCRESLQRKWVPPFEVMESLVNGLVKMSKAEEAKEVVEKMKKRLLPEAVQSWAKIEATLPL